MKLLTIGLCLLAGCRIAAADAQRIVWQPSSGHTQIPIWPGTPPDSQLLPGSEYAVTGTSKKPQFAGRPVTAIHDVAQPTMTIYAPKSKNTGAAVVVFPGGGFEVLAIDLEGTEACDWLVSKGITCILLKYRVPSSPYSWQCDCRPHDLALSVPALEDAERTVRLVRFHANEWHVDRHKVGVLGFSGGGYLVAEISTNFKRRLYAAVDAADKESARPDFAMGIYPGHLATDDDKLNQNVPVSHETPPTFLVQAENDYVDGVHQSLVYYAALAEARVPAEMHLFAEGGHAFGLRHTHLPVAVWPRLAEAWLRTIGILPKSDQMRPHVN